LTDFQKQSTKPPSNKDSEDNAAREKELFKEINDLSEKSENVTEKIKRVYEESEKISNELESILNSGIGELFDKLQGPSKTYNKRVDNNDYKDLLRLARIDLHEPLLSDKYKIVYKMFMWQENRKVQSITIGSITTPMVKEKMIITLMVRKKIITQKVMLQFICWTIKSR
jgi:predicted nuclease with TOPRIM domain